MKLAFITATPQNVKMGSGTFVTNIHLTNHLRSLGHTVDVFAPKTATGAFGYMAHRFYWNWRLDARQFDGYDGVIGIDMDGYTIANQLKCPFIAYILGIIADEATFERGWVRQSLQLMSKAERLSVHRAKYIMTISDYSSKRLVELYDVKKPIKIIPPSIDLQAWESQLAAANVEQIIKEKTRPTVLCVGVQYPRKNVATLIKAAAILRKQIPNVEIRIASKGPEWDNLRQLSKELELEKTVNFLGYIDYQELINEYLRCDVFCLPSLQEGFGLVFAEAMASRKPVVASRSSSTPEMIEDGVQGLLATPLDAEDLANQLAKVLLSPEKARILGEAGYKRVQEFDAPKISEEFSQLLRDLIQEK